MNIKRHNTIYEWQKKWQNEEWKRSADSVDKWNNFIDEQIYEEYIKKLQYKEPMTWEKYVKSSNINLKKTVCVFGKYMTDIDKNVSARRNKSTEIMKKVFLILGGMGITNINDVDYNEAAAWIWIEFETEEQATFFGLQW